MRSKPSTKADRKAKRWDKLHKQGKFVRGVRVPDGAIPADPSKQAYPNSLSVKYFYTDIDYVCRGCGGHFTWTNEQQKRYYEEQKGNLHNQPTWCTPCHKDRMAAIAASKIENGEQVAALQSQPHCSLE